MVFLPYCRVSGKEGSEHLFYGRHFPNTIIILESNFSCVFELLLIIGSISMLLNQPFTIYALIYF